MKNKLSFMATVFLVIALLNSCTVTRDNYNPIIDDEEAVRELIKVKKCLNIFESNKWTEKYTYLEMDLLYKNLSVEEIKTAIYLWSCYGVRGRTYKNDYVYRKERPKFSEAEAEDVYETYSALELRNKEVMNFAETILYNLCDSQVVLKEDLNIPVGVSNKFMDDLIIHLNSIFNNMNTPRINKNSRLINDNYKSYQVWIVSEEGNNLLKNGMRITVFFNEDKERIAMRLFHSK